MWQQILPSREQAWLRASAAHALQQLDALDHIDRLQPVVAGDAPPGGFPFFVGVVVRRGRLRGIPLDPAGVPFHLDPETGRVTVSEGSPLFPMPADVRRELQ